MVDPVRGSADLVARVVGFGLAGVTELARLGSEVLLAAVLTRLRKADQDAVLSGGALDSPAVAGAPVAEDSTPEQIITRGLLAGEGRFTRFEVAERAGMDLDKTRRLWRALGFPEVDDDQRIFTNADVAALADANGLIADGIVDLDALVELARPLGNLMARLAAAQTVFISDVLGARIAEGMAADDPQLPDRLATQALITTRELLPVLELTTMYTWRRHLAAEVGRALVPNGFGPAGEIETRPAAVGFIDITGYTRLSRNVELTELAALLNGFETAVLDIVVEHGGRVIKNLGDEILFVIEDPVAAAEAALRLLDEFKADDTLPSIHAGLAFGPVLDRGGDVYGPVVNVAARLTTLARKGTIRVDQAMATELGDAKQFALAPRAPRHVRGYLQLPSYRLRRAKNR